MMGGIAVNNRHPPQITLYSYMPSNAVNISIPGAD